MRTLFKIVIGFLGGVLYAFINFCLVTPFLRDNTMAVLFWGGQGAIFSMCYMLFFSFLPTSKILRIFSTPLKGGICGLFSALPNIILSWLGFAQTTSVEGVIVLPEVSREFLLDLLYYVVGCIVLGAIVVLLIENMEKKQK